MTSMMRIDLFKTSPDRAGRYFVLFSDGSSMRLYRQTVEDFALYTGKELDDEEMEYMEELMAIPSTVRGSFFEASEYMVQKHLNDIVTAAEDVASLYEEIDQYLEQSGPALIADDSDNLFSMYEDLILQIAGRKGNVSTLLKKAAYMRR